MSSIENLNWRYATKEYASDKKLSEEQLQLVKESLRLAPSSFGLQPWKFIHVTSPEIRSKLKEASWNQTQLTDASEIFVLCAPENFDEKIINDFIKATATERGQEESDLDSYKEMIKGALLGQSQESLFAWSSKQIYLALGMAIAICAENRIDTTPMEGFDRNQYDEVLGLKDLGLKSVVVLAVGFRKENDKYADLKKVRYSESEIFIEK